MLLERDRRLTIINYILDTIILSYSNIKVQDFFFPQLVQFELFILLRNPQFRHVQ